MTEREKSCSESGCTKESCEGCDKNPKSFLEKVNELSTVKKVVGIISGKGGVGKSFVTAMLAVLVNRLGYNVGILDADITGPSIPKMFGISKNADSDALGIYPERSHNDIKIMSVNLLLEKDDMPVIWRGPILAGAVKQFWTDVIWGDLDIMFIDMPPGTGDVPLTVFQSIPLDGVIIVTSPQDLVSMIVKKAYNMAAKMNIPVLGVIENMSYIKCPDCGKEIKMFGESKLEEIAKDLNIDVLGRLPIEPAMASLADSGNFERFVSTELNKAVQKIENSFLKAE